VAIITLLVAILIPSLSRARDNARMTVCGTNLNGIFKAFLIYNQDWGGNNTMSSIWGSSSISFFGDYIHKQDAVLCPSLKQALYPGSQASGYGAGIIDGLGSSVTTSSIPGAGTVMFLGECGTITTGPSSMVTEGGRLQYFGNIKICSIMNRPSDSLGSLAVGKGGFWGVHGGKGNVAWYDGHVSVEKPYNNKAWMRNGGPTATKTSPGGNDFLDTSYIDLCQQVNIGVLSPLPTSVSQSVFRTNMSVDDYFKVKD